jgi:hypothetical protein
MPTTCFLDEPTSGLDPTSAAGVMARLRDLADLGVTVVLTTHDPAQVAAADQAVLVARAGHVAYAGPPAGAPAAFGVARLVDVYERLAATRPEPVAHDRAEPEAEAARRAAGRAATTTTATDDPAPVDPAPVDPVLADPALVDPAPIAPLAVRHRVARWWTLTRRTGALLGANRLTLAVLAGSPVLVISMMVLLFPEGASGGADAALLGPQVLFWMAFAAFFFGLTYGLLQIVTERDIQRRERHGGITPTTYLAAKLAVLGPMLAVVCGALLAVLVVTDRLPSPPPATAAALLAILVLVAASALALGMLASATVRDAAQATLALPMLCFPQVLFAGAVVPLGTMGAVARALSLPLATRWGFEALGRTTPVPAALEPAATVYPDVFGGSALVPVLVLVAATVVCLLTTGRLLRR